MEMERLPWDRDRVGPPRLGVRRVPLPSRRPDVPRMPASSDCATPSLDDEGPGEVKELSEICDAPPPDEPASELMKESRVVGFWYLESLVRRVTLSPKNLA